MPELLRRNRLLLTTVGLLVVSGQLMSLSLHYPGLPRAGASLLVWMLSPAEIFHHELTFSVRRGWEHYVYLQNVETERNELVARVRELEAQNSRLTESEHENKRLKELLNYEERTQLHGVAARVVGRDPSNWARTITIDRGRSDGIRIGLPAVDGNAVVGQVVAVSNASAQILLLSDNSGAIDALVQNSRAQGTVEGALGKKLYLRYVLRDYEIVPGDRVIASGLDGVYPKGTLVGVVTRVEPAANGLFQNVELEPSTDLTRLENVLVLIDDRERAQVKQQQPEARRPEAEAPKPETASVIENVKVRE